MYYDYDYYSIDIYVYDDIVFFNCFIVVCIEFSLGVWLNLWLNWCRVCIINNGFRFCLWFLEYGRKMFWGYGSMWIGLIFILE